MGDPGADPPLDLVEGDAPGSPAVAQAAQAVAEPANVVLGQAAAPTRKQHEAEKRRRFRIRGDEGLARMQFETTTFQIQSNAFPPFGKHSRIVVEQREIVHITHIPLGPQHLLAEMIQRVEIKIGEELACQIANRQAAPPFARRKQIVAGKIQMDLLLRIRAVDYPVQ